MTRMQAVGYDSKFRFQILKSAIEAFKKKTEWERNGGTTPYTDQDYEDVKDKKRKRRKKSSSIKATKNQSYSTKLGPI